MGKELARFMARSALCVWCLLLVGLGHCAAVSQAGFVLEGDLFKPNPLQRVEMMGKILTKVDQNQQMTLLKQKVSELSLKARVKDEENASLRLSRGTSHSSLGESDDLRESHNTAVVAPLSFDDAALLKELPADVRDEVSDFYSGSIQGANSHADLGESDEEGDTMFLASSSNTWKLTRASDQDEAASLTQEFPDSFGSTAVVESSDLGESIADSCRSVPSKELCLDDTASWIQYSVHDTCGAQLCMASKQICVSKDSFQGAKSQSFEAKCPKSGKATSIVMLDQSGRNKVTIRHATSDKKIRLLSIEALKMSICQGASCSDRKVLLSCTTHTGSDCVDSDKGIAMQYL